jgi:hypothetical protein
MLTLMTEQPKRRPGRPEGKAYPVQKLLRLTDSEADVLRALAARQGVKEAEVVRRLLQAAGGELLSLGLLQAQISELREQLDALAARVAELEGRDGAE